MKIELLNVRIFISKSTVVTDASETAGMNGSLSIPVMRRSAARPGKNRLTQDGGG